MTMELVRAHAEHHIYKANVADFSLYVSALRSGGLRVVITVNERPVRTVLDATVRSDDPYCPWRSLAYRVRSGATLGSVLCEILRLLPGDDWVVNLRDAWLEETLKERQEMAGRKKARRKPGPKPVTSA